MLKRPTSKDVARLAGVSQTVVSFVLNDHPSVAPQTRERVREAARSLGYRPDAIARNLVRGRTHTIGVLMVDIQNPFFARVTHLLEEAIREAGYHFVLSTATWDAWRKFDHVTDLVEDLLARRVEAVLAWGALGYADKDRYADPFHSLLSSTKYKTPHFSLGYNENADGCVTLDHKQGGALAALHLLDCGCRRLGIVTNNPDTRCDGFLDALREKQIFQKPPVFKADGFEQENRESGYAVGRQIAALAAHSRPDGLFCHNDMVAIGVLCGLQDGGVRVPEEIALVGFDALEEGLYVRPTISSVEFPVDKMCRAIVDKVVHWLDHEGALEEERVTVLAPSRLRLGRSTARQIEK